MTVMMAVMKVVAVVVVIVSARGLSAGEASPQGRAQETGESIKAPRLLQPTCRPTPPSPALCHHCRVKSPRPATALHSTTTHNPPQHSTAQPAPAWPARASHLQVVGCHHPYALQGLCGGLVGPAIQLVGPGAHQAHHPVVQDGCHGHEGQHAYRPGCHTWSSGAARL